VELSAEGSRSKGKLGGEGRRLWTAGLEVPVVLESIWYAVFLNAPRALAPMPQLLGDVRAMGEKPLKGRMLKGFLTVGECEGFAVMFRTERDL